MNIYDSCDGLIASVYTYSPSGTYGPRVHSDLRLVYNYTGSCDVRIDDAWHHVGTGEMIFLLPGTEEEYRYDKKRKSRCGWCAALNPQPQDQVCQMLRDLPAVHSFSGRFQKLAALAEDLYPASSTGEREVYDAIVEAMFREFFRIAGYQKEAPVHPAVEAARRTIERDFGESLDVAAIAHRSGVSPQHLVRLFKQQLKTTPTRLLWETRCESAARMLQDTGFSAGEIAYRCGFSNPNHFSRVFKIHHEGVPPSAFRRRSWGAES
ncbi:MAG: AraC family transcriptional regulator [Verrucomicrobiota bacterium]